MVDGKYGQGTHSTKMVADKSANNTPSAPKLICPNCLPKPKSLGFRWKQASLCVRSPWLEDSLLYFQQFGFRIIWKLTIMILLSVISCVNQIWIKTSIQTTFLFKKIWQTMVRLIVCKQSDAKNIIMIGKNCYSDINIFVTWMH